MSIDLKIPDVGESITEVQISEWLKAEGDSVKPDEPVAVIDSEKATFELPAPRSGRLTKILHQAGETVGVGMVVAQLDPEGEIGSQKTAAERTVSKSETKGADEPKMEKAKRPEAVKPEKPKPADSEMETTGDGVKKKLETTTASENSKPTENPVPVGEMKAAGVKSAPTGANRKFSGDREEEVVPMTMLRRTVARHLVEARQTMAMLTTFNEVDMSAVQTLRQELRAGFENRYQVKLGLMSFFTKAAIDALKRFPQLNAEIRGNDIVYRNYFDIGVAIALEHGLVVPVLRNAERLSFAETEKTIADFARRAKAGQLNPDELDGGTFTITNGGVFGSLLSTPIINPPQAGILGLHAIQERPIAARGQIVIRPMMYVALTYDHRIVDGREAVLFLRRIKEAIEKPSRMLLEA